MKSELSPEQIKALRNQLAGTYSLIDIDVLKPEPEGEQTFKDAILISAAHGVLFIPWGGELIHTTYPFFYQHVGSFYVDVHGNVEWS